MDRVRIQRRPCSNSGARQSSVFICCYLGKYVTRLGIDVDSTWFSRFLCSMRLTRFKRAERHIRWEKWKLPTMQSGDRITYIRVQKRIKNNWKFSLSFKVSNQLIRHGAALPGLKLQIPIRHCFFWHIEKKPRRSTALLLLLISNTSFEK